MADTLPQSIQSLARQFARQEHGATPTEAATLRARREALLEEYGFHSRIREDERGSVLVCYPSEWIDDGTVVRSAIDDIDRAVEIPLFGGPDQASWTELAEANTRLATRVREEHGDIHGENAEAFVEFMNNHRSRPVSTAEEDDIREFLAEYYPRNAWPSDEEKAVVEESIELLLAVARSEKE